MYLSRRCEEKTTYRTYQVVVDGRFSVRVAGSHVADVLSRRRVFLHANRYRLLVLKINPFRYIHRKNLHKIKKRFALNWVGVEM